MKNDTMSFTTTKSLGEVANAIRDFAASQKRTTIERIVDDDPLGGLGVSGKDPDIMVVVTGQKSAIAWAERWAVQVYVTEEGHDRKVDLIALGDSFGARMGMSSRQVLGGQSAQIQLIPRQSRDMMQRLASALS